MNKPIETFNPLEYAKVAVLARETEAEMLTRLDLVTLQPQRIVDMGCGIGTTARSLQARYPNAEIFGVDCSEAMLAYAKQTPATIQWLCNNADNVPFEKDSVDLIVSNLLLPWCTPIEKTLAEWRRILCPEGLLMFTSFGPDTLIELQHPGLSLPNFTDMHNLGDALLKAGFTDPVLDVDHFTLLYRDSKQLLHELSVTGMLENKAPGLIFEDEAGGKYPITYEVIYGHTWGQKTIEDNQGTVKISFADLRAQLLKKA